VPASRAGKFAFALILLVSTAAATSAVAQDEMRQKGNRACSGDARRLCKDVLGQGDMVVLSCFQANASRLSAPCRKFLREAGQL
jgi:hypothetical protein